MNVRDNLIYFKYRLKILENQAPLHISRIGNAPIGENDSLLRIPRIIWIFWNDNNYSQFVAICIKQVIKLNPDYTVNFLTLDTVKRFLPDLDFELLKKIPIQNFSDLIRLRLLVEYGGIWMDASVLFFRH